MQIEETVPLASLTTFGIGGPARYFAAAKTIEDLREAIVFADEKKVQLMVLGGGSNVLFADEGFEGLIIKMELLGVEIDGDTLIAAAGECWDAVVARAVAEGLWGIENLSGIPGTLGGAVVQNIGAYGAALSEVLEWAEVLNVRTGEVQKYSNDECAFDYRDSIFKHDADLVVVRAALRLSKEPKPDLSYRDLKSRFEGQHPTLQEIRDAVVEIRKGKFPDLSREGSAGSFFKNPTLPEADAHELQRRYPEMPLFPLPESTKLKVPLAWLLDKVLNLNGYRLASARLYEKQPIVLVADRRATAADVIALARQVHEQVRGAFGFEIEEEVKVIATIKN